MNNNPHALLKTHAAKKHKGDAGAPEPRGAHPLPREHPNVGAAEFAWRGVPDRVRGDPQPGPGRPGGDRGLLSVST